MATVAPASSDQTADLLQKLSLDSQNKALDISEPAKKLPVSSVDVTNGQNQSFDRSLTPVLPEFIDPNVCYMPNYASYYYGGYDGTGTDWDDYSKYMGPDGVDMTRSVYSENGSVMYHGYGYAPYGPYTPSGSPVPTVAHDGQLYGAQQYQYPTPYFQPSTLTSGPYPTPAAPLKGDVSTTGAGDKPTLTIETANVNSNGITNVGVVKANNGSAPPKSFQNSSYNSNGSFGRGSMPGGVPTSAYQNPRFGYDSLGSPVPWMDVPLYSDYSRSMTNTSTTPSISSGNGIASRNQNTRPKSNLMGLQTPTPLSAMNTNGYMNRIYPNKMYNQYTNTYRSGYGYGSGGYESRTGGRGWFAVDSKYRPRGRGNGLYGYGNENMNDGLNELNRGPRAKTSKNQKGFTPVVLAVKGQSIPLSGTNDNEKDKPSVDNDAEQYNRADFPDTHAEAKFFIIKSYSEDDVHKSIKYSVWASTQSGNKKLDAAYQEAQQKSSGCPIFLLFSVNTSGQFVGIAEMLGPVDFNKSLEYWQQDKWVGCFPVKWHIVKDIPNSVLKHITLENNENKPVTNSRDTQEVKLEQGLQLLKIFKEYSSKQCILDDFGFYEDRQRRIQEKKAKQQQFQKQVWEGKPTDEKNKDGSNAEATNLNSNDAGSELVEHPTPSVQTNGKIKVSESSTAVKEAVKVGKPIASTEKKVIPNGVANGC